MRSNEKKRENARSYTVIYVAINQEAVGPNSFHPNWADED